MEHGSLYIIFGCIFGLLMTWGVGANDLANVMSTTLGSKAITPRQAMFIAIIFEFAGAFLGGSDVTLTMRDGIINFSTLTESPLIVIHGMLAVLMAGMTWMATASYYGLPVSITNAIVGAVVGFGSVVLGLDAIHWKQVSMIAVSWLCSPIIAGIFSFLLFMNIQSFILGRSDPVYYARRYLPFYLFFVGLIIVYITLLKGLEHFHVHVSVIQTIGLLLLGGIFTMIVGHRVIHRIPTPPPSLHHEQFVFVEKLFSLLMALTACAMVFAHGANDVSVAVGPITVITGLMKENAQMMVESHLPMWITLLGVIGVILGLLMYGRKVIQTVGNGITTLTPSRAFAATLAAALAVVAATSTGIPVSATQTLVGAVLGVGLARGIGALNLIVIRNIFMSWIITLPASCLLTIFYYNLLRILF